MSNENKWIYSFNEELWGGGQTFETKDEAIAAAKADPEYNEYNYAYVAEKVKIDKDFLLLSGAVEDLLRVDFFNEKMAEVAGGDEDWLPEDRNVKELEDLKEVVAQFILEKCSFGWDWCIENIQEIK